MFSWIIAGVAIIILALVHAELGGMFPLSGATARYPHFSHGSLVSFAAGWITWLGAVTIAPIEVLAVLTYASTYAPWLITQTVSGGTIGVLSAGGYVAAAVLMLVFTVINLLGVKAFAEANAALVWFKIAVPLVTAIALFAFAPFDGGNLTAAEGFAPTGFQGVLTAISAGGVFFAMFGFDQAIQLGGESSNPGRNIPIAVIGSVLIGTTIYIALQFAFLGALPQEALAQGWAKLTFENAAGPYAGLAFILGLSPLAYVLLADAAVSPAGTGLIYTATSSRLVYGMSRTGFVPPVFERTSSKDVPIWSILLGFVVGLIVFFPFPSWQKLVGVIVSAYALVYAFAPVVFGALRRQDPERDRPYRLAVGGVLAPLAFVAANFVVYFVGWTTNFKVFLAAAVGAVVFGASYLSRPSEDRPPLDWRPAAWIPPWIAGSALISYFGSFEGGTKALPFGVDLVVVAVFSLVVYAFALSVRLEPEQTKRYIDEVIDVEEDSQVQTVEE